MSDGVRVLVCGSRKTHETYEENLNEREAIMAWLDMLDIERGAFSVVIHGCATGVDSIAEAWAQTMGRKALGFRAEWDRLGKRAGPIRNQRMLDDGKPDLVIAFPGGRGTADMVSRAIKAGVEVVKVELENTKQ